MTNLYDMFNLNNFLFKRNSPIDKRKGIDPLTYDSSLETGSLRNAKIANLNANKITAGTIDASSIGVTNINASNITSGTLNAGVIKVASLDGVTNATGATVISGNKITTGTIDASQVVVNNIDADRINTGEINASVVKIESLDGVTNSSGSTVINGSKITTGTINANLITAGTITGRRVRTSSGDNRVEMNESDNANYVYASGNKIIQMDSGGQWVRTGNYISFGGTTTTGKNSEIGDESGNLHIRALNDKAVYINNDTDTVYLGVYDGGIILGGSLLGPGGNISFGTSVTMNSKDITSVGKIQFSDSSQYINDSGSGNDLRLYFDDNAEFYKGGDIKAIIDDNIWTDGDLYADGSKPFLIPHPDGSNRYLKYTAQESPDVVLRLRGKATFDSLGIYEIVPPKHYELVTESEGLVTVNLTSMSEHHVWVESILKNEIIVVRGNPGDGFMYEVMAIRKGYLDSQVEINLEDPSSIKASDKFILELKEKLVKEKLLNAARGLVEKGGDKENEV